MKQFIGLLKFEHKQYGLMYGLYCVLILIAVFLLPHGLVYINSNGVIKEVRFIVIIVTAIITFITSIGMFAASLNNGKDRKEIWLHSTAPIYKLIGAKFVYALLALIAMEACAFLGFFFIKPYMSGTIIEYVSLMIYFTLLTIATYCIFISVILAFYAYKIQLEKITSKFNNVILFFSFILFFYIVGKLPDTSFLQHGFIDMTRLNPYMPRTINSTYEITMVFKGFYILEEIVTILMFTALAIASCKWIERVLTR